MRVAFVLPAPVRVPMGGAAVVFRHAAGLGALGHDATVIAPKRAPGVWPRVRRLAVVARDLAHGVSASRPEAAFGARVEEPETLAGADLAAFDAVIATGHQTAPWVADAAHPNAFYFLQGDERAIGEGVEATWALPLRRFAVSRWLADLVEREGHPVEGVVPNAVDPDDMYPTTPPADRARRVVALYHRHPVKGPDTLVEALDRLKASVPGLEASVVAARPPSHRLPDWVGVHVRPSRERLRALYDGAAVCLHTSRVEGWGLVPMEAAACACAVAATASRGPREFLTPGESMLEVPVGDAAGLAESARSLLVDPDLRSAVAGRGLEAVRQFSWADSTRRLEAILRSAP